MGIATHAMSTRARARASRISRDQSARLNKPHSAQVGADEDARLGKQRRDIFERQARGLGHEEGVENEGEGGEAGIHVEGAAPLHHVTHGEEGERRYVRGAAVDGGGDAHRLALDLGGEDLGEDEPRDRAEGDGVQCRVRGDRAVDDVGRCGDAWQAACHLGLERGAQHRERGEEPGAAPQQQRAAAYAVDVEQRVRLEDQLDDAHADGAHHRRALGAEARLLEEDGRVIDDALDPDRVLERRDHRADDDGHERGRLQEQRPRCAALLIRARLDLGERRVDGALRLGVHHPAQHLPRLLGLSLRDEEARRLGQEQDAQREQHARHSAEGEHPPPLVGQPREGDVADVGQQHAERERHLGERDQRASERGRRNLRDEHRRDEQPGAHAVPLNVATEHQVRVRVGRRHQERAGGEHQRRHEQRRLAPVAVGDPAARERTHDRRCVERGGKVTRLDQGELELVLDEHDDPRHDPNIVAEE
mmetsp:Transcript_45990/g.121159  ORF Transcript_45990/g.121159 Transcript_45990/m.121159 type:complete len:477 (+) Transcript_45990:299-1729(+)